MHCYRKKERFLFSPNLYSMSGPGGSPLFVALFVCHQRKLIYNQSHSTVVDQTAQVRVEDLEPIYLVRLKCRSA